MAFRGKLVECSMGSEQLRSLLFKDRVRYTSRGRAAGSCERVVDPERRLALCLAVVWWSLGVQQPEHRGRGHIRVEEIGKRLDDWSDRDQASIFVIR